MTVNNIHADLHGKRVVVTGASGFIGSRLCNELDQYGCEVHAISRNPINHSNNSNIIFEKKDLTHLENVRKYFRKINPHYTFHTAGKVSGSRSIELVPSTFQNNLVTSVNMLTVAAEQKPGRLILMGSLEEPEANQMKAIPSSPYAISKWAATTYAKMFHRLYDTPIVIIRLFMVYGPQKQDPDKLLPYVIRKLLKNESPKLGNGQREIDWIYIDDVIEGLVRAAVAKNIEGQTIDLGSGKLISIKDLVERIKFLMNSYTEIQFNALTDRLEEQIRRADTPKTFSQIQWKPQTELDEGLKNTIDWYKKQKMLNNKN